MPWFKVDDGFAFHPKAVAAGNAACGLWARAGSWCAQQLTDGHVPKHMLAALGGKPKDAAALVAVGLWEATGTGWKFHQWNEPGRQPTREEVEADRAAAAARVAAWRQRKRAARDGGPDLAAVPDV